MNFKRKFYGALGFIHVKSRLNLWQYYSHKFIKTSSHLSILCRHCKSDCPVNPFYRVYKLHFMFYYMNLYTMVPPWHSTLWTDKCEIPLKTLNNEMHITCQSLYTIRRGHQQIKICIMREHSQKQWWRTMFKGLAYEYVHISLRLGVIRSFVE